jgi:hypothetical protein
LVYRICASSEVNLGLGFLCHWSFLALFLATRRHWSWKPLTNLTLSNTIHSISGLGHGCHSFAAFLALHISSYLIENLN